MSLEPYVSELTLDPFPLDTTNGRYWRIQIRLRPDGMWALHNVGEWLQEDRTWHPDVSTALRFPSTEAATVAARIAVQAIDVNGHTYAEMAAKWGDPS